MNYFTALVCVLGMLQVMVFMPLWIYISKTLLYFQPIREDGPISHHDKKNTPSMGGVVLWLSWMCLSWYTHTGTDGVLYGVWLVAGGFFLLGCYDDVLKICRRDAYAFRAKPKFIMQCLVAALAMGYVVYGGHMDSVTQTIPMFGDIQLPKWCAFFLGLLTIVATSNAVNLADGLDGLATSICLPIFVGLWLCNTSLPVLDYPLMGMVGILLGNLWFNSKPAGVWMGDCGALFLGALLGACAASHVFQIYWWKKVVSHGTDTPSF